jgi:hypothetical protein
MDAKVFVHELSVLPRLKQHIGPTQRNDRVSGSFFCSLWCVFKSLIYDDKITPLTLIINKKKKGILTMKNICNIISGPVGVITGLAILTLTILEIKEKIQMKRMKKEHVASQSDNQNGQ